MKLITIWQNLFRKLHLWRKNWNEAKFIYFYARGWQGEQVAQERFWRTLNWEEPKKDETGTHLAETTFGTWKACHLA